MSFPEKHSCARGLQLCKVVAKAGLMFDERVGEGVGDVVADRSQQDLNEGENIHGGFADEY